jgi:hypothetical protein
MPRAKKPSDSPLIPAKMKSKQKPKPKPKQPRKKTTKNKSTYPDFDELKKIVLAAINDNNLYFITDVFPYLPCSTTYYYNHDMSSDPDVVDAIMKNRIRLKQGMRRKWSDSDSAQLQTNLYRLIADDDEYQRLTKTHQDITTNGKDVTTPSVIEINIIKPDGDSI